VESLLLKLLTISEHILLNNYFTGCLIGDFLDIKSKKMNEKARKKF